TRRAVAHAKAIHERAGRRVHRPWVAEPGLWLQYDYGDGPVVGGVKTVLFIAWLALSRFRIVILLRPWFDGGCAVTQERTTLNSSCLPRNIHQKYVREPLDWLSRPAPTQRLETVPSPALPSRPV